MTPASDEEEEIERPKEQHESAKNTRLRKAISIIQADSSIDGQEKSKRIQVSKKHSRVMLL